MLASNWYSLFIKSNSGHILPMWSEGCLGSWHVFMFIVLLSPPEQVLTWEHCQCPLFCGGVQVCWVPLNSNIWRDQHCLQQRELTWVWREASPVIQGQLVLWKTDMCGLKGPYRHCTGYSGSVKLLFIPAVTRICSCFYFHFKNIVKDRQKLQNVKMYTSFSHLEKDVIF